VAILYLDSSAAVKLYVGERHDDYVERAVSAVGRPGAGIVAVSAISYPEISCALAAKARAGLISADYYDQAMWQLRRNLANSQYLVLPATGRVIARAGELPAPGDPSENPGRHRLKGYDAVQLATALEKRDELAERARRETAERRERMRELPPERREPVGDVEPEELLLLSFDNDLHDAAVAEGIAHARPDRSGGRAFGE
jgi:predicted nucleic acid-binding protein